MKNEQNILAIDTATAVMAGATLAEHTIMAAVQSEAERNHSIHIMTNIEKLIADSKWTVKDVTHYVVGIGPGSYTGTRIAVSAIKTLAWVTKASIVSVSSLEGLAYSALEDTKGGEQKLDSPIAVIPIMDARRGQVYTACFECNATKEGWQRQHDDHIIVMESWVDSLVSLVEQHQFKEIWIVGDVHLHTDAIARLRAQLSVPVQEKSTLMNGAALAKLGQLYANESTYLYEGARIHQLAPNYAQLTEAEVKQNAKEKEAHQHG